MPVLVLQPSIVHCGFWLVWPGTHMDYGDGTLRYEPNRFQHHHIICTACNRTIEFLSLRLEALIRKVQQDHDFTAAAHGAHPQCMRRLHAGHATPQPP